VDFKEEKNDELFVHLDREKKARKKTAGLAEGAR